MKDHLFTTSRYDFSHYYDKQGVTHPFVFPSRVGRFLSWEAAQRAANLHYAETVEFDTEYYDLLAEGYTPCE